MVPCFHRNLGKWKRVSKRKPRSSRKKIIGTDITTPCCSLFLSSCLVYLYISSDCSYTTKILHCYPSRVTCQCGDKCPAWGSEKIDLCVRLCEHLWGFSVLWNKEQATYAWIIWNGFFFFFFFHRNEKQKTLVPGQINWLLNPPVCPSC